MIEILQGKDFSTNFCLFDTETNKVSTRTGHGIKKLLSNLETSNYGWWDYKSVQFKKSGYNIVKSYSDYDELKLDCLRIFPEYYAV